MHNIVSRERERESFVSLFLHSFLDSVSSRNVSRTGAKSIYRRHRAKKAANVLFNIIKMPEAFSRTG